MRVHPQIIYLIVSGAVSTSLIPDLIQTLTPFNLPVYTFMTSGAHRLTSPWRLAEQPGHRLVESYFDPILAGERQSGLTLVAPATFNTVNKISQGIADSLALSLVAEAIGAGWPVIVVPAVNVHLADHPRFKQSLDTLRSWRVTVLAPDHDGGPVQMASKETVIATIKSILEGNHHE